MQEELKNLIVQASKKLSESTETCTDKDLSERIFKKLEDIENLIIGNRQKDFLESYIPIEIVLDKLGVSKRTFYNLKDKGLIEYYQQGRKKYMTPTQIHFFMEQYRVKNNVIK